MSRIGDDRYSDYLWERGEQVIFEVATLGSLIPGYGTMSLIHGGTEKERKNRKDIYGVELSNLPYKAKDPLDYLYRNAPHERYPMSFFMRICDPAFVKFIFVRAK